MNIVRFASKWVKQIENNQQLLAIFERTSQANKEGQLQSLKKQLLDVIPDSPIVHGFSVYSQNDEDGILDNIFARIGVSKPNFFEFGVAPEENNTNYLLLKGGRGCWIDKGLGEFKKNVADKGRLKVVDEFITLDNILGIFDQGLRYLNVAASDLDLVSLDLDGNDYYFIEKIFRSGILPKVFCLEYNALFPPPLDVKIRYSSEHRWEQDDYFGCSLSAYDNLLSGEYILVACNITGSNCFFVRKDYRSGFGSYPVGSLYQPARYYHSPFVKGHPSSSKFILDCINE